jgi:hypothetical protein
LKELSVVRGLKKSIFCSGIHSVIFSLFLTTNKVTSLNLPPPIFFVVLQGRLHIHHQQYHRSLVLLVKSCWTTSNFSPRPPNSRVNKSFAEAVNTACYLNWW